jgi:hypothetical protein
MTLITITVTAAVIDYLFTALVRLCFCRRQPSNRRAMLNLRPNYRLLSVILLP